MRRLLVVSFMATILASIPASVALAQVAPQYMSSEPADGDELHQAPDTVTATFSEPLDDSSKMVVKDHCGNRLDDGNVTVSVNELSVGIEKKPAGHYMVAYAATGIGGVTGNTNGTFSFEVHAGTECDGGSGHHQGGTGMHNGTDHSGHSGESGHPGHESGTTHEHSSGDHTEHGDPAAGEHSGHTMGTEAEHQQHNDVVAAEELKKQKERRFEQIATGGSPYPGLGPDSEAVLISLGLAAAFGLLGGWVLRVSNPT